MPKIYRSIRVVRKDGTVGSIAERSGDIVSVQWDDGKTELLPANKVKPKGRGRRLGDGVRVPKDPTKEVHLERAVDEVVRKEMDRLNLTQRELAKRCDISRRTLQRILQTNAHWQRIETLEAIATALGISPARFWDVTTTPLKAA